MFFSTFNEYVFKLGKSSDLPEPCRDVNWRINLIPRTQQAKNGYLYKSKGESLNIGYIAQAGTTRCKIECLYQ